MLRTVELGRAVISATETTLELWLTTLITLSPKQDCINFAQLNHPALFDLLTSGEVWVDQMENMQFVLDVSVRGEPIDRFKMRALARGIVDAPAWRQFNLSPTEQLHFNDQSMHINLGRSPYDIDEGVKRCHRLISKVVPDGIPTFTLHSVHLSLVVLENRNKIVVQRQRKPRDNTMTGPSQHIINAQTQTGEVPSARFDKPLDMEDDSDGEILFTARRPSQLSQIGKRKRSITLSNVRIQNSCFTETPRDAQRHLSYSLSNASCSFPGVEDESELRLLSHMVDAAVRFSVLNTLKGSASGLKVKANTFTARLADIAPVVWRPGFLSALSQRACLAPTLSLSLSRIASKAMTLMPLLSEPTSIDSSWLQTRSSGIPDVSDATISNSGFPSTKCTWVYTHKSLLSKPVSGPIQPLCIRNPHNSNAIEISLAEPEKE